jgi:hypothetical protein
MSVEKRIVPPKDLIETAIQYSMHGYTNLDRLADVIGRIIDTEAWRHASLQRRGDLGPFGCFWDWAEWKLPDGMETSKDKLLAMLEAFPDVKRKVLGLTPEAGPVLAEGVVLNKAGVNQHTRKDEDVIGPMASKPVNTTAEGILARLKRDHPQIAQAFIEGEYPSAASAGRAAGISWLQTKSPLEKAQAAFRRLTKEDRDAFDLWRNEQTL